MSESTQAESELEALVRDVTKVHPMSKSEARSRITALITDQVREAYCKGQQDYYNHLLAINTDDRAEWFIDDFKILTEKGKEDE